MAAGALFHPIIFSFVSLCFQFLSPLNPSPLASNAAAAVRRSLEHLLLEVRGRVVCSFEILFGVWGSVKFGC